MKDKRIPDRNELRDCNYAVAGHAGTLCDEDGQFFVKPCTQAEIDFYNSTTEYPEFADIMPRYIGSLALNKSSDFEIDDAITGIISETGAIQTAKAQIEATIAEQVSRAPAEPTTSNNDVWIPTNGKKLKTDLGVVLGNETKGFVKPNILDLKLGTRLWADDAPAEKKQRFDEITSKTTHGTLGFRIAGMRAYRGSTDATQLDDEGYLVYDKDYGRDTMNTDNILDGFRNFVFNAAAGIDEELGRAICEAFAREVGRFQAILEAHETRMYSSSLLCIFEGDGEALRAAIDRNNEAVTAVEAKFANRTTLRTDSGIAMGEDDELIQTPFLGDDDELIQAAIRGGSDDDDDDDDGVDMATDDGPRVFSLKLIDFAHAKWTPGQGPDENLLRGIRSVRQIFEQLAE
ncbi:arginine metabolism regulation protein iii [Cordyceps militaris CM01]|uniref:Kinase n=1 Tax=Cordyceps militaris (strain CM01) TaxID=983644 RepID=G3JS87_CORMM|nr:arginine metabolism regulation protein iii [Cordyceps militaris CM01]EGX88786.1 arginine metabolism regulation protein iii [Cordyceps militaris CM01]